MTRLLRKDRVISDTVLSNVTSTKRLVERRKVLLAAVKDSIHINHCVLQTFSISLIKADGNTCLGEAIHEDYRKEQHATNICINFILLGNMFEAYTPSYESFTSDNDISLSPSSSSSTTQGQ